jgi:hypothetical protein
MHLSRPLSTHYRLSNHARARMQQRSIPLYVVEMLLDLADPIEVPGECAKHSFNAHSWREARDLLGRQANQLDRYRYAYAIVSENGTVVTVGWLH